MKRTWSIFPGVLVFIAVLVGVQGLVDAQGDGDGALDPAVTALLAQLRGAYETTAAEPVYTITSEDESIQATSVRRLTSGTYLMDVTIFESVVSLQTIITEIEATVNEAAIYTATVATELEQQQGLGFEYVRDGEVLSTPEDTESELELNFSLITTDGTTYINSDATGCEYRVGVPEGWRVVEGDGVPVLEETTLSGASIREVEGAVSLDNIASTVTELLQPEIVIGLDVLGTEEINDELARRYLVTLDGPAALETLGITFEDIIAELETAAGAALSAPESSEQITYTLEILIGDVSDRIYEQTSTLQLEVQFTAPGNASAAYNLTRTNTITLSAFGEMADVEVPELGVPNPDDTCVQDTTIDDTVDIEIDE
jgi:hypothetical protein